MLKLKNIRVAGYILIGFLVQYGQLGVSSSFSEISTQVDEFAPLGVYKLNYSACVPSGEISLESNKRYPLKLVLRENEAYFLKKIDSSCSYQQFISINSLGYRRFSLSFGNTKKIGHCYFSPESLVASPLEIAEIETNFSEKEVDIVWEKNPSLRFCQSSAVTWNMRLKKSFTKKNIIPKLANATSELESLKTIN